MKPTPRQVYGLMAGAEMVTWTALILAMVARYGFGYDGGLFFVAGLSHGIIFLAYCVVAVMVGVNLKWGFGTIVLAVLSAIPPWLTLPFDRWLHAKGKLDAPWQLESAAAGEGWFFRFIQYWLRRPVFFLVVMTTAMAVVLYALLVAGPPTQWGVTNGY
jgi:integral membrane protein